MNNEQTIMKLIMHGGNARSKCMEALEKAQQGDFIQSKELMQIVNAEINLAHEVQTDLIREEIRGMSKEPISLLMVHAQDHLMNAMTVRDLASVIIGILKEKN